MKEEALFNAWHSNVLIIGTQGNPDFAISVQEIAIFPRCYWLSKRPVPRPGPGPRGMAPARRGRAGPGQYPPRMTEPRRVYIASEYLCAGIEWIPTKEAWGTPLPQRFDLERVQRPDKPPIPRL